MPRKVLEHTVPPIAEGDEPNRDAGKTFVLTEMPVLKAEKWAMRAFLAIARNGMEVPPEALKAGFAGLVPYLTNLIGAIRWEDAEPLLDEMLTCIQFQAVVDGSGTKVCRKLIADDIEEVGTLLVLRKEVVQLHKGFLKAAALSSLGNAATTQEPRP